MDELDDLIDDARDQLAMWGAVNTATFMAITDAGGDAETIIALLETGEI